MLQFQFPKTYDFILNYKVYHCSDFVYCNVTMMLLRSQSISYFNFKRNIWLNHIEPSEQRL